MQAGRRLTRLAAAVAIVLSAATLAPVIAVADNGPVVTDCAPPPPIDQAIASADLVFVGAITDVANGGRSATVAVKEVWRGDVPPIVTVNGGADPTNPAEDDRVYSVATAYLFIPVLVGGQLVDGVCSSTVTWTEDLVKLRPADAHGPDPNAQLGTATPASGPGPLAFLGALAGPLAMAGIIGGGTLAFAFLVSRRRDS